jgi:hypothetical protein
MTKKEKRQLEKAIARLASDDEAGWDEGMVILHQLLGREWKLKAILDSVQPVPLWKALKEAHDGPPRPFSVKKS